MSQAPEPDVARARARRAGNLLNTGRLADALPEYDWLWRHLHHLAPDMAGFRGLFMAGEMGQLCRTFAPAQAHFELLRDHTEAACETSAHQTASDARLDWMVLNEIVGQAERTLLWFDRIDLDGLADPFVNLCIPRLVPLLRRRGRWAEIGRLFRDPLGKLGEDHGVMVAAAAAKANRPAFGRMNADDLMKDLFREQTRILCRGLRAAGRADEAAAAEQEARRLDPGLDMHEMLAEVATAG